MESEGGSQRHFATAHTDRTARTRCGRRVTVRVDHSPLSAAAGPGRFDELIVAWMWLHTSVVDGRRVIAFDGKTLRGTKDATGNLTHLLAGLCQRTGAVIAQLTVAPRPMKYPACANSWAHWATLP